MSRRAAITARLGALARSGRAAWGRLSRRERALALAIAGVCLLAALLDTLRTLRTHREELDALAEARAARDTLLGLGPLVEKRLAARAADLAVARSLDPETVLARLEKLTAAAKLVTETTRPATRDTGACRTHTVVLRADAATLEQLIAFRRALDAAGLPLAMTGLELDADTTDPVKLRARLEITAIQPK